MNNLIYFTIGNNSEYIKLAQLCINSLQKQKYNEDILFITDNNYINIIKDYINWPSNKLHLLTVDNQTNLISSSANKLKIYKFANINKYINIIYCDIDILWTKNPNTIFNLISNNKIYISRDNKNYTMAHKYWGGDILTEEEKYQINSSNTIGLNAGLFAFNIDAINIFIEIDKFFNSNIHLANVCLEQPFINTYLYRNQVYNLIPEDIISHDGYLYENNQFEGTALHFAGGPGNYSHKFNKMTNYYTQYFS